MTIPDIKMIEAHASHSLWEQMRFARQHFFFPHLDEDLVRLKITYSRRSIHSARRVVRGGRFRFYEIQLNTLFISQYPIVGFSEYVRYERDPEIGGFTTNDWKLYVDATIAHELAHVIQFLFYYQGSTHPWRQPLTADTFHSLGVYEGGHGEFFQAIYRQLRQKFINHRIQDFTVPDQSYMIDDFEERLAAMPPSPLQGIKTRIGGTDIEVIGVHPDRTKKLFRYVGRTASGSYLRVKLKDIVMTNEEAAQIVARDPNLLQEYKDHVKAISRKKIANARSSITKRSR